MRKPSLGTVLWLAVLGFLGMRLWPELAAAAGVGGGKERAPELRLATLAGDSIRPESLSGKVVLVNFWATWCPPCRVEMPGFESVWRSRASRGFAIVGLADDAASAATIQAFLRERGITYPVAKVDGALERAFGSPNVLPTSFLIDRSGRIRYTVRGIFAQPALALAVDRLLKEPAPADAGSARSPGMHAAAASPKVHTPAASPDVRAAAASAGRQVRP